VRLLRLIPNPVEVGTSIRVDFADGPNSGMLLTVVEVTKYTYLLTIVADGSRPRWLPEIEVKVRVYNDARMAEVIEWCSDRTIPWLLCENSGMQARDEKWQWNSFLSELLSHGLSRGMSKIEV
tara:strand:- start:1666 stop:2034 length:369 start_codon:yes stop_codon:yes gene_type:complete